MARELNNMTRKELISEVVRLRAELAGLHEALSAPAPKQKRTVLKGQVVSLPEIATRVKKHAKKP